VSGVPAKVDQVFKRYFGVGSVATPADVRADLWMQGLGPRTRTRARLNT
jgi:hypothetical protein